MYHPSVNEEVSIERPFDQDCFRARVESVSGEPGDPPWDVEIKFERLDGVSDLNPTYTLSDISWTFDPAKLEEYREFQSRLIGYWDRINQEEQRALLENY